ncbi:acyltransferase family protein [Halosquirtibacter laminarini]|uniref:Acyltransferase family protein n=1 Tax=Halosquirtibacter laminarini TaxID=3374600 RepID=A0AC61NLZ4_9BACT|nr:acyltransferase family protein [Prolixibacteraceae bacterium]
MGKRESNLDLLRVLASLMVIVIHVSNPFAAEGMNHYDESFMVGNFFYTIACFSAPMFMLLSGGFMLSQPRNRAYKSLFETSLKRRLIYPTIFWSLFYVLLAYLEIFMEKGERIVILSKWSEPLKDLLLGSPCYHLWYMFVAIGLNLMVPLLIELKEKIGEEAFMKLGLVVMLLDIPIAFFSDLFWVVRFIIYLGYFMLGYSLKHTFKCSWRGRTFLAIAILMKIAIFFLVDHFVLMKSEYAFDFFNFLSPFAIIYALCFYMFFLKIRVGSASKVITSLARHSFHIYLIHALFVSSLHLLLLKKLALEISPMVYIPVASVLVFGMSWISSNLLNYFKERIYWLRYSG